MANLICAKCNKPINEENLIECPHCWEMYHKECWEETKFCLNCKKYNLDFAKIQAEKEALEEQEEKQYEEAEEETTSEELDESVFETPSREMNHSPAANAIMLVSKVLLIIGAVAGVTFAAYMIFITRSIVGGAIGVVAGGLCGAIGWAMSVLVNGFAELINNSQKTAYYLSKLVDKKEKENDE